MEIASLAAYHGRIHFVSASIRNTASHHAGYFRRWRRKHRDTYNATIRAHYRENTEAMRAYNSRVRTAAAGAHRRREVEAAGGLRAAVRRVQK